MKKSSKRLVIDASVARACGDHQASSNVSKICRDVLDIVLEVCHRMVIDQKIIQEWDNQQSRYAEKWRVQMRKRGKTIVVPKNTDVNVFDRIVNAAETTDRPDVVEFVEAVAKDIHLIEAGLRSDLIVISLDKKAKANFEQISMQVGELANIEWINPELDTDVVGWLKAGAKNSSYPRLGSSSR